jgi:crotonobetainyl-CoA:carnitine CoA-transferase CaiB-like acyl-CoA transferase
MPRLLDDVTVLDLSWGMAGPFAGMLMADNGADVIKVEPPGGDPFRFVPSYHVWNRGKRSVILDLRSDSGKARFLDLCCRADVLLESFRPDVMDGLGLGYEALARRNPRLIHVSINGYGSTHARANEPGYEHLVDAWLGLFNETQCYRGPPGFNAFPLSSFGAGQLAAIGALAAMAAREITGMGQHVETSLVDGAFVLNTMQWQWSERASSKLDMVSIGAKLPRRHLMSVGILRCGDGRDLWLHTGVPGRFAAALEVLGIADKVSPAPPNLEKNAPLTEEERQYLLAEIPRILKTRPRDNWITAFQGADICCLPVDPPGVIFRDPQTEFDRTVVSVDDPDLGPVKMVGPVLKCADAQPRISRPAPRPGQHTDAIMAELGKRPQVQSGGAPGSVKHPLEGIRILDFGSYFAGPSASKILADLGAEVIKIEPLQGDTLRGSPGAFRAAQRGKRSLAIDVKASEGRAIVQKLVQNSDIVTHNMRPGAAERAGIGYADLARLRPDLIYLHSPGFGNAGPRSNLQAFAPLVSGMVGLPYLAAGEGNPPLPFWVTNEDQLSGPFGACWMLMALHHRRRTGRGLRLESSLFSTAMMAASEVILDRSDKPIFRFEVDPAQTGYSPLCRLYKTGDAWLVLIAMLDKDWQRLCKVEGLQGLADDHRFAGRADRAANPSALGEILESWFAQRTGDDALRLLRAQGVPCELSAPSRLESWFFDDDNIKSGRVVHYTHAEAGEVRETGHSIRFSATPGIIRRPSPLLGEHTREILRELGFSDGDVERLREQRVVTWKGAAGSEGAIQ